MNNFSEQLTNTIYGVAVGDALGNPVQFYDRERVQANPVTDMVSGGVYHKKAGTWTDDTSMTLCLLASLGEKGELDYEDVMKNFQAWLFDNKFTTESKAFDVGRTCAKAIFAKSEGNPALECGGKGEHENGNGSLMRISPIVFYIDKLLGADAFDSDKAFEIVHNTSSLTHAHPIALIGCDIYVAILLELLHGCKKEEVRLKALPKIGQFVNRHPEYQYALDQYSRIIHMSPTDLTNRD